MSERASETPSESPEETQGESQEQAPQPQKRRGGAPFGNINNLQSGLYSKSSQEALKTARKGKLKGSSKRLALRTLEAVLADQGDIDDLPMTLRFLIDRFARRVGRVAMLEKAVEGMITQYGDKLIRNPKSLAMLFSYLQSAEDAALSDARTIGFVKKAASADPLGDYVQNTYSNGKDHGEE